MPDQNRFESLHTRREFIKNVLRKSAYAAPFIATFTVADVNKSEGQPSDKSSGREKKKISKAPSKGNKKIKY